MWRGLLLAVLWMIFSAGVQAAENVQYINVTPVKTFHRGYDDTRTLEIARTPFYYEGSTMAVDMQRAQLRDQFGRVVAYTPTRVLTVPFCPTLSFCRIFQWKTVYPLPAVYKFDSDVKDARLNADDPPMIYTRRGGGVGVTEIFNPLWGVFGLILMMLTKIPYFSVCILLSIILTLQVHRYHGLPHKTKRWVSRLLMLITMPLPGPFSFEPYSLTACVIAVGGFWAIGAMGIPFVVTVLTVMVTFFLCSYKVAKLKAQAQNI